ncbi:MAG: glycosyltransferase family 4 protein, partial [Planctomycetota bacterium]
QVTQQICKMARWPHQQLINRVRAARVGSAGIIRKFEPDAIWSRSVAIGAGLRKGGFKGKLLQIFPTNARMDSKAFLQTNGLSFTRRATLLALWPSAYAASSYYERLLAKQCELVTFSKNMRQQLLASLPQDVGTCTVIRPGVDSSLFSPEQGAKHFDVIRETYGLQRDELIVLYVGRLSRAKNIPMLLDAVKLLKSKVKLVLVGDGTERQSLECYAQAIGLADRLVFAGEQREWLPGFYALSRVFVLPTITESFGHVFLEALSCGTPAVGFGGNGKDVLTATREIICHGESGRVAEYPTAPELAQELDAILSLSKSDYSAMSQAARRNVVDRFTWQRFVSEAIELSQTTA